MKSRIFFTAIAILALGAVLTQVRFGAKGKLFDQVLHASAKEPVGRVEPTAAMAGTRILAEGRLGSFPGSQIAVSSERRGILETVAVKENQTVRKGDLIAELRADDIRAQIAQAKAKLGEIEADIRLYESEAQRYDQLYLQKVGTRQAAEKAERDVESARARLVTQKATVQELEADLSKTRILAPISGTVLSRKHHQGESVDAGETICTLADLNRVRIETEVDEFDSGRVRLGQPVTVHAEGYRESWRGHVQEIPHDVEGRKLKPEDPGKPVDTRVLLVKVVFDEKTPLKLGQRVEVEMPMEEAAMSSTRAGQP